MKFAAENMHDVWTWLDGIDANVTVELGPGVALPSVSTVADVRALPAWPPELRIVLDDERQPVVVVRIERR
jgi:hypothetical protein